MTLPDLSFQLPNLSDTALYPVVSHGPGCVDPPPTPATCFPDTIVIVRPFLLPTEPLGQLTQPLTAARTLIPAPPSVGVQCPSLRFDLVAANSGAVTGTEASVGFLITRPENDACLPVIEPLFVFPCTSITANANGAVTMVNGPGLATVAQELTANDTDTTCSTNLRVNVAVPCVVPSIVPDTPANLDPTTGATFLADKVAYNTAQSAYLTALSLYTAEQALYASQAAAYPGLVATYNADYATYLVDIAAWRLAVQQQPQPVPLPPQPAPPIPPVKPVAPVGPPPAPVPPTTSSATIATSTAPSTTLISPLTASLFDIGLNADPTGFLDGDVIQVDGEHMVIAATGLLTITVQRAVNGTPLETHAIGALISVYTPQGGKIQVLVSGPPCDQVVSLAATIRFPTPSSSGSSGSTGGGGFTVGTTAMGGTTSPFHASPYATTTTYPPLAIVPIIDTQGIISPAGTQVDNSVNLVLNATGRTLANGDVVTVQQTTTVPGGGYTVQLAVV